MKNLFFILAMLVTVTGIAQTTIEATTDSINTLVPDNQTRIVTPNRLRRALKSVANFANREETPEKYGAKGDGLTNDYAAFVAFLAANAKGKVRIPAKTYNITGTLTISKGANGTDKLSIEATGAKIVTGNSASIPVLRIKETKNLAVTGLTISGLVDFDGMWYSTFQRCSFQDVKFGFTNAGIFDEFYWNRWERCDFREIWVNTGTALDRTEFNANTFQNCQIWQGDYAFRIYGNQNLQGISLIDCDVSYQNVSLLFVNEPLNDGVIFMHGGYLDSDKGFPMQTKGVRIVPLQVYNPNSANGSSFTTQHATRQSSDLYAGVRAGSRFAISAVNLLKNGDLSQGTAGIYNSGMSMTLTAGTGHFGNFLACYGNQLKYIDFESIPAPMTGTYNITAVGRNNNNTSIVSVLVVNGVERIYNPVTFRDASITDNSFIVSSAEIELNQGDVLKVRFYTQEGVSNSFDLAYVGCTLGKLGVLYAPLHPLANASGYDVSGIGLKTTYSSQDVTTNTILYTLPVANYTRVSAELVCYCADVNFPDGATYSKHVITANRLEGAITYTLLPITASSKAGDVTAAPTIAVTDAGGGVLQIKATASDGVINAKCKLEGRY